MKKLLSSMLVFMLIFVSAISVLTLTGCGEDPLIEMEAEARAYLADGDFDKAIDAFLTMTGEKLDDPRGYWGVADALEAKYEAEGDLEHTLVRARRLLSMGEVFLKGSESERFLQRIEALDNRIQALEKEAAEIESNDTD
jgi:hypothetical protein